MAQIHLSTVHVYRSVTAAASFGRVFHPCSRRITEEIVYVTVQAQLLAVSKASTFQLHSHHITLLLSALCHRIMYHDLWKSFLS